jgi:hypothetical protein
VAAPLPAAHLRVLLVRLVGAEVGVAHEVYRLAVFTPRFNALLRQSQRASTQLGKALKTIVPPKPHLIRGTKKQVKAAQAAFAAAAAKAAAQQADAIDVYDAALGVVLARMRHLQPPPVMAPAFRTQLQTLAASRRAGNALAAELRKKNRSRVGILGRRFTLASRAAGSLRAQRLQIAAIKAYNARVQAIGAASGRVQTEVARLQRTL